MSDYFKLPVNYDIDICKVHAIGHNAIEAKVINLKVVCHAINNHDKLTEQNAKLVEMLESIIKETDYSYALDVDLYDKANQLLTEIKEQNNE
jgi:hypothetical protein